MIVTFDQAVFEGVHFQGIEDVFHVWPEELKGTSDLKSAAAAAAGGVSHAGTLVVYVQHTTYCWAQTGHTSAVKYSSLCVHWWKPKPAPVSDTYTEEHCRRNNNIKAWLIIHLPAPVQYVCCHMLLCCVQCWCWPQHARGNRLSEH